MIIGQHSEAERIWEPVLLTCYVVTYGVTKEMERNTLVPLIVFCAGKFGFTT
ncbi:hypothetical protein JCM19052_2621 [Vibrio sp. JCM 19052]|nr:hypothetical protein JCM19052_2621 [Vibrio sp. JCM 19052]